MKNTIHDGGHAECGTYRNILEFPEAKVINSVFIIFLVDVLTYVFSTELCGNTSIVF